MIGIALDARETVKAPSDSGFNTRQAEATTAVELHRNAGPETA